MLRFFERPVVLCLTLLFLTSIPIVFAGLRLVQLPLGTLPEDSLRVAVAPASFWLHAAAGVSFGLIGPLQFARVLRRRFGGLHRLLGRVFVVAGVGLGLSGLSLLVQVDSIATPLLDIVRALAGGALVIMLVQGIAAARHRDTARHRAFMIRAYAIGMGSGTVAFVMLPIYLVTGEPVTGLWSDLVFVGSWGANLLVAEWVIARGRQSARQAPTRALA